MPGHRHLAAAVCVVLLALPAGAHPAADSAVAALDRAVCCCCDRPRPAGLVRRFLSLLDALILTAPHAPSGSACLAGLLRGRDAVAPGRMLHPATLKAIHACFRDTHGGEAFGLPPSVRSGGDPAAYCRQRLADARLALLVAHHEEAFGRMIEATALVVTPVERGVVRPRGMAGPGAPLVDRLARLRLGGLRVALDCEAEFARLVLPHRARMQRAIWGVLRDADLSEDALQDALVILWRKLRVLRHHPNPEAFVLRVSIDAARDQWRARRRRDARARPLEAVRGAVGARRRPGDRIPSSRRRRGSRCSPPSTVSGPGRRAPSC